MLRGALCLAPTSRVPAFEQPKRWCPPGSAVYRADHWNLRREGYCSSPLLRPSNVACVVAASHERLRHPLPIWAYMYRLAPILQDADGVDGE